MKSVKKHEKSFLFYASGLFHLLFKKVTSYNKLPIFNFFVFYFLIFFFFFFFFFLTTIDNNVLDNEGIEAATFIPEQSFSLMSRNRENLQKRQENCRILVN